MNKTILIGRLTKDVELKQTAGGISKANFTVAVDRKYKSADGIRETDFIPCVAWRQTADNIARFFDKGRQIALVGSIQVRSWDNQDGQRQWMTEVVVDEFYFVDSRDTTQQTQQTQQRAIEQAGYFDSELELPSEL